ncbi:MAG TPA: HXXEE domain-containing protein [Leptospiraceae bacterium]|nr:HXXEE domain-containing protein [Leptospiraceae bacterium]HMW05018.1 HXXEE domain-containing protein [Leptospiraceae bacterium]HMX31462.1 HXXEE domain-containing protein [Leptospiraceae bacterium]HMY33572.1 HXXEE domain-containing protein [Leptospiraceae bacterium]HMZ62571.1 HXXEE domain-containing protein [Leptospiraceae bacterium]
MNQKPILSSILLLFAMLWLPLGQEEFLLMNWMKIGTYVIPFLFIATTAFRQSSTKNIFQDTKLISVLLLIVYLIHQYEEHWIDLFGNEYSFYYSVNQMLSDILSPSSPISPLTREAIFVINTSLVWLVGVNAIWMSETRIFPTFAMTAITLVNAITHVIAGIVKWSYNPGLVTSILLFIPFTAFYFHFKLKENSNLKKQIITSILWAVIAHILMVSGMLMANYFHVINQTVYFVVLILWSILPIAIFRTVNLD